MTNRRLMFAHPSRWGILLLVLGIVPACGVGSTEAADVSAPQVLITDPPDGATVGGTVIITALATDDTGVTSVKFFIDGTLLAEDQFTPYSANWNTRIYSNGSHIIKAEARDAVGNFSNQAIGVTVDHSIQ